MRLNIPLTRMHRDRLLLVESLAALVVVLALVGVACAKEPVSPDREALVEFYNSTDGENWSVSTNWLTDEPIGSWYGVTTNDEGRVTRIVLENNRLNGPLPAVLGRLSALEYLKLSNNRLAGPLPPS